MKNKLFQLRTTNYELRTNSGSALILAVVLVSLLAVVGVMFAMVARIDKMSTSAIAENKTLNLAVDTVIAKISQELASDTPGLPGEEYYDYPDVDNAWLASLEPYESGGDYYWQQISNITGSGVPFVDWPAVLIPDYPNPADVNSYYRADADGDGVSDSMWVKLDNITSGKGKPVYVAVRIIDNGGMLNVNTGYKFDPCSTDPDFIDGSSQLQINLMALAGRPTYTNAEAARLLEERVNYPGSGIDPNDLNGYKQKVVWRYNEPNGPYTPFDVSDELEIRYRFLVNQEDIDTRLEVLEGWDLRTTSDFRTPAESDDIDEWFISACDDSGLDPNYAYRHIATTYNMDRIINPVGPTLNNGKMVNINEPADANANELYGALVASIDPSITGGVLTQIKGQFAQLAANIVDFADDNIDVTVFRPEPGILPAYYGFDAQPFITEIGFIIDSVPQSGRNYYAVELYNPFNQPIPLEGNFELVLMDIGSGDPCILIPFGAGEEIPAGGYLVIANDPGQFVIDTDNVKAGPQLDFFGTWEEPSRRKPPGGGGGRRAPPGQPDIGWSNDYKLFLRRSVGDPADPNWIYVDRQQIDPELAVAGEERYFGRDMRDWRVIYQTPDFVGQCLIEDVNNPGGTLGGFNNTIESIGLPFGFFLPNPLVTAQKFVTVGDIPCVLTIGHSTNPDGTIGQLLWETQQLEVVTGQDQEHLVRLDLQNPDYSNIFQYLTVFDPTTDGIDNDGDGSGVGNVDPNELKIPGRININTAPWYVIAQLPWVSAHTPNYELARAIIAYRDKLSIPGIVDYSNLTTGRFDATDIDYIREEPGFASIGELATVVNKVGALDYYDMRYYALDLPPDINDLDGFPDLTPSDGIANDFEERDVIFSRISNLVTVRSDVFTAYILVRIGTDGPQKRVIAILDRSDVYPNPSGGYTGRVKARALHPVADPR